VCVECKNQNQNAKCALKASFRNRRQMSIRDATNGQQLGNGENVGKVEKM